MKLTKSIFFSLLVMALLSACGGGSENKETKAKFAPKPKAKPMTYEEATADWKNQKGIGPIKSVTLGELDPELAKKGSELYILKCTACHAPDKEKLGPAPVGVLERRTPEWVMNLILNPQEMTLNDPIARGLLMKYNTVMADQGLTEDEARAILEYFRTLKVKN